MGPEPAAQPGEMSCGLGALCCGDPIRRWSYPCRRALLFSLLVEALAVVVLGQDAGKPKNPNAEPTLKIESNLVVVRAVVRDSQGRAVKGLTRDDFKVLDRGKEQAITHFEELKQSGIGGESAASGQAAAAQGAGPATERYIALYFDDLDTAEADLMQARDAADRYFTANLRTGDHVAIFTASKALSNFTSDPKQIHEVLFQLHADPRTQARVHECPDLSDYQAIDMLQDDNPGSDTWVVALAEAKICAPPPDPRSTPTAIHMLAERIAARAQGQARDNLGMLGAVVKYIAGAPGQRSVILVSGGFQSMSEQLTVDRTIDRALRAQVVINSLDPKGLAVMTREGDASNGAMTLPDPHATASRHNLDRARESAGNDVLAEVAQGTGGEFFHDNNDLRAGFDALAGHPDEYVLAFAPKDMKLDGKYHELKVMLAQKQKGYGIQARRGYFAVKESAAPEPTLVQGGSKSEAEPGSESGPPKAGTLRGTSEANTADQDQQKLREALRSSTDSGDLGAGMEASPSEGEGATRLLALTVHLDTKTLPLRTENTHHADAVTFAVAVFDQNSQVVEMKQRQAKVDLTDDQLADFLNDGLDVNMMFEVKPGTYRLRAAVIEANEHKLAAFSREVAVP